LKEVILNKTWLLDLKDLIKAKKILEENMKIREKIIVLLLCHYIVQKEW
jgi:hypothetical protein